MNRRELISDGYLKLQQQMHRERTDYGISGQKYAQEVQTVMEMTGITELLDYGAGRETLREALPQYTVHSYDPAVPWLAAEPEPHDVVVCTDVLEHIEEDKLDAVLSHIKSLTRRVVFFQVSTRLASKTLPDGRNTHINLHNKDWWLLKIMQYFSIENFTNSADQEFLAICSVRQQQ